jgi:pyrroline-5-carboxylate reductase
MDNIGFIGGGRIVKIFLQAWKNVKAMPSNISILEKDSEIGHDLKNSFGNISLVSELSDLSSCNVLFIALHPPVIKEMLEEIAKIVDEDAIIISLAPKIDIAKMRSVLGSEKIVRMIPNATSYINKGFNPLCFSSGISSSERNEFLKVMKPLGDNVEVLESDLEGYAIISAMLPTYFWPQWKTILEMSKEMGIDEAEAKKSVQDTLHAAIDLMFASNLDYETMSDLIPVKPLANVEKQINESITEQLLSLYQKIKP